MDNRKVCGNTLPKIIFLIILVALGYPQKDTAQFWSYITRNAGHLYENGLPHDGTPKSTASG
jgi:hypothetical protein